MTNKSNKEIIIEASNIPEIRKALYVGWGLQGAVYNGQLTKEQAGGKIDKFIKEFASTLLSKLNRLDRVHLEEEIVLYSTKIDKYGENYNKEAIRKLVDQILQLIPEEGVVIAEGEVVYKGTELMGTIGKDFMDIIMHKLNGKKGKLVFIEDKED